MPGLAAASENVNKERFLGFRIISRPIGGSNDISYFLDPDYFSGNTFRRNCKVRIIAFAGASNDHQNINVQLSGVGELVNAWDYDKRYLKYTNNVYEVSSGQYLTVNNSGNYSGISGYVVYLAE
ncbi:hypothetical protein [uncultured Subdoligranulum sp.]|uniref:hypothetical protein n=1 Tax=uncultured Subdoligranulum sp. TaxID=512298 RepID=UPI002630D6E4|nr:hypothetical protein [uncultured Subdoligranulum sp.]